MSLIEWKPEFSVGNAAVDHEALLDQLSDIIYGIEIGTALDEHDLSSRLNIWFTEHFGTHDARLHRQL